MLVARCASENGSRAAKCGYAHASRKWFTSFTLREDSRAPTSLRSPTSNTHSLPRASLREGDFCVIPTVCHGHPVQSFSIRPLSSKLGRVLSEKSCGERGIRTPETLLEFTRFPGVPLQPLEHLSFVATGLQEETRSASLACRRCFLLNRTHEVRFIFYSVHDRHKFSMNIFGIGAEVFSFARRHNTPNDPQRYKKYLIYA